MCSQSPPWWVHCQHQHKDIEREEENSLKWPKAKEKPKRGHLKWAKQEQNLVPKDMGNGSTQPSKSRLALKKRQMGSTPLAKLKAKWRSSKRPEANCNATPPGKMQSLIWMHTHYLCGSLSPLLAYALVEFMQVEHMDCKTPPRNMLWMHKYTIQKLQDYSNRNEKML